jgi:hypothetical protein
VFPSAEGRKGKSVFQRSLRGLEGREPEKKMALEATYNG